MLGGIGEEQRRGGPCFPPLPYAWRLASRPFAMRSFLIPCASPCPVASGKEGALWGVTRRTPVEGSTSPTNAPGLHALSPHMAICHVYLLTSLLIYVLSLRPEGIVRSPRLIGISTGQSVTQQLCGRTRKRIEVPLQ